MTSEIAITGASGLIGRALAASLRADGHTVRPVVRTADPAAGTVRWDPAAGTIDAAALEGVDAVVHLAGEGIASHRWTAAQRARIHDSRQQGTQLLATTLANLTARPAVLVSGSAVGIYGVDNGDTTLTEASPVGTDFLAEVCTDWEAACAPARDAGIRVAHARTGVVLSATGGALAKQLLPFRLGLGGKVGNGSQYLSWITLADEVAALRFLIDHDISGPVNLTAPAPVTNAAFTKALGRALHRPTVFTIPRLVTRLPGGIGALAESLLFASQRAVPQALLDGGFTFGATDIDTALQDVLARG